MSRQLARGVTAALLALIAAGCATGGEDIRPLQARAAYERGLVHLRERQPALALGAIQEAIALDGEVPVYWNTLGWLYLQLGRVDQARAHFARAIELDTGYAEAHMNLGIALAEGRAWDEAVAAYRRAIALPTLPSPHVAYQNLGLALYHLERYQEAEEALRFALGLDPKLAAGFYNLGLVLAAQQRRDEARAAFRQAHELAPQSPFGHAATEQLRTLE